MIASAVKSNGSIIEIGFVGFCLVERVCFIVSMNLILFRRCLGTTVFYAQLMGVAVVTFFADIIKLINIIGSLVAFLWGFIWLKYIVWKDSSINNKEMI
jgi:hypothetical protein